MAGVIADNAKKNRIDRELVRPAVALRRDVVPLAPAADGLIFANHQDHPREDFMRSLKFALAALAATVGARRRAAPSR